MFLSIKLRNYYEVLRTGKAMLYTSALPALGAISIVANGGSGDTPKTAIMMR